MRMERCEIEGRDRPNAKEEDCMFCRDYGCEHRKQMVQPSGSILPHLPHSW